MPERIGVFICECGPNLGEALDFEALEEFARGLKDVVFVERTKLLCDSAGRERLRNAIGQHRLSRVVAAACSPKEHERTFREVLKQAGLNPFMLCMANIREQCAWVSPDKEAAGAKARAAVCAAVRRVVRQTPLSIPEISCRTDVVVVGAGVAGIGAALALAGEGRKVRLVEKSPCIGGAAALHDELFYGMGCASCRLDPLLDEVLHHENIEAMLLSQVTEVRGFFGHFEVRVEQRARKVNPSVCIGCGSCSEACPVSVPNEFNQGRDLRKAAFVPYPGALPHVFAIDSENCLESGGTACGLCETACPFGAVNLREEDSHSIVEAGAIVLATGFALFDPSKSPATGYRQIENVLTSMEFERMLGQSGPTGGEILLSDGGVPRRIALVHCVGSRNSKFNEYCSGICCSLMAKYAARIREKLPDADIFQFFSDLCLPGKEAQPFFARTTSEARVNLVRLKSPDSFAISDEDGRPKIIVRDVSGKLKKGVFDMVVLAVAMEGGPEAARLGELCGISCDRHGFFSSARESMALVCSAKRGIYVAGACAGPKNIERSIAEGQAAAGLILSELVAGKPLDLPAEIAEIDAATCSGCGICRLACPFGAIVPNRSGEISEVRVVLCRGCGICAAACPSGAVRHRHYSDEQIEEEIKGVLI